MSDNTAKIVHLIGQLKQGGAERQLVYTARGLQQRGWPQAVVSFDQGGVWKNHLLDSNIPVLEVPRHPVRLWRLWQLYRLMRREKPQIAISWSPHVGVYARQLVGIGAPR